MSENSTTHPEPEFVAFVGIDWADQKHVWSLQTADSQKRESGELEHAPEAVEVWVAQFCQRFAQGPIAVALEQSRGSLVFMLSKYEWLHLFPVPSTMAGKMRDALYPSGARMIPGMRTCSWIYCCSIATSYAVCHPIRKRSVACKIWWRNGASWWMRRQSNAIV